MIIDQATNRYGCDICEEEITAQEMLYFGDADSYDQLCYQCFIKQCRAFVNLVSEGE